MTSVTRVSVDVDVVLVRDRVRRAAAQLGLSPRATEEIVLAVSELATNILRHAGAGEIRIATVERDARQGLFIEATDSGPGIERPELAIEDGYSSAHGLGVGLPGALRLSDEFELSSAPGRGTRVTLVKWV